MRVLMLGAALTFGSVAAASAAPIVYSYTGGFQTFMVSTTGLYNIVAFGAQGGQAYVHAPAGGLGAEIGGDFQLTAGQTLAIAVGGIGGVGGAKGAGGGGGTFVVLTGAVDTPLTIAGGGGGGAGGPLPFVGAGPGPGQASSSGMAGFTVSDLLGTDVGGAGGVAGAGGAAGGTPGFNRPDGAGGGGYLTSGGGSLSGRAVGGASYAAGLAGGTSGSPGTAGDVGAGGFGGGGQGGGITTFYSGDGGGAGGGGGGYSGGGGGGSFSVPNGGGGGGGSFNGSTFTNADLIALSGVNSGNGLVTINLVSEMASNAVPEASTLALTLLPLGASGVLSRVRRRSSAMGSSRAEGREIGTA